MPKGIPKNGINKGWIKKGSIPWCKGLHIWKDKKHPRGMAGKINTQESNLKRSISLKGIKKSKQHAENISKGLTGQKCPWAKPPHFKGEKHYNWKGGITPVNTKERNSQEGILWRKACMERDNFTCAKSGQRGGRLVVHHINNFSDFPELRTSISNGITLSVEAHKEFHKIYGKKNNTVQQLLDFIN
jgi:hypothetical protein